MDAATIQNIVKQVLAEMNANGSTSANGSAGGPAILARPSSRPGVFAEAEQAIEAANEAQKKLTRLGYAARKEAIQIIKQMCADRAEEWGKLELAETKVGRLDHKIEKLHGISGLPGAEWLSPYGMSGDHGISLEEQAPFGTVAAISPVTHSIPTIASNAVSMIAAGNSLVVNAHPGGAKCAATGVAAFNEALEAKLGLRNLITIIEEPSLESFDALIKSSGIDLICVTGGPGVVKAAMASGKRAICAGPGNPPVLVEQSADLAKAARDIIAGASYDNNLLCIGEKQVFVVDSVFDQFLRELERAGAMRLNDSQLQRLTDVAFTYKADGGGCSHPVLNRKLVGADATTLAQEAGTSAPSGTDLLFAVTDAGHPFVEEEQMMPMLPIVRVRDVEEGIALCKETEHNYRHSAICHSRDIGVLTAMGRALNCTLFVKNGPSFAGLGMGGEGYLNFTIATTTGEGIVTPATFTRKRRCVMVDNLNIVG